MKIDLRKAIPAGTRTANHPKIRELRTQYASGVYVILDAANREVLYVGESHTGRLYDTLTRHFRYWGIDATRDAAGRRRGGPTYHREDVLVTWAITTDANAPVLQRKLIAQLDPEDNIIDFPDEVDIPV